MEINEYQENWSENYVLLFFGHTGKPRSCMTRGQGNYLELVNLKGKWYYLFYVLLLTAALEKLERGSDRKGKNKFPEFSNDLQHFHAQHWNIHSKTLVVPGMEVYLQYEKLINYSSSRETFCSNI